MLIDSMIIRIIRVGFGIGPEYSLSIYGDGRVIYDGTENVKVNGIVESSIDNDKVMSILSEIKKTGFFSLDDSFLVEEITNRPYTKISISLPMENGEVVTKSTKYYQGDRKVPKELKNLEDKIEEIVGSSRWIGEFPRYEKLEHKKDMEQIIEDAGVTKDKPPSRFIDKKYFKLMAIGVAIIILVAVILFALYSGIISFPSENKESDDDSDVIIYGENLEITILNSTSYVDLNTGNYTPNPVFWMGDTIWIYQKFANISTINNETCDLYLEIIVTERNGTIYHFDSENRTKIDEYFKAWHFETNGLWLDRIYYVTANITDNISNETAYKKIAFTLIPLS